MTYKESKMSVEWLESKIQNEIATYGTISPKMISIFAEQAKAIHKEEHFKTWWHDISENEPISFEQYYNETFGNKK